MRVKAAVDPQALVKEAVRLQALAKAAAMATEMDIDTMSQATRSLEFEEASQADPAS